MSATVNTKPPITSLSGPALPFWRRIRWNLILNFVVVAVVPTIITIVLITSQLRSQAQEQVIGQLESVAALKVQLINQWLIDSQAALHTIAASDAEDQRFSVLTTPQAFDFARTQSQINAILKAATESHSAFNEIFFYDVRGNIQSSSALENIGKSVTRQPYYMSSLTMEYTQSPYYQVGSGELTALVTYPVRNINNQVIGVLTGRLNLEILGQIMLEKTGLPKSAETYLVSAQSNYLLTPSQYEGYEMTRAYHSLAIDRALAGQNGSGTYDDYRDPPVHVLGVYHWVPGLQAALLAEQDESEALQAFSDARFNGLLLGVGAAVIAALFGLYAAARFSRPILALTDAATRITIGDLKERAVVRQRNELGVLAAAFNGMADQLQQMIGLLEERVAARTRDLFLTLEVGQLASRTLQQADLLPRVSDFIRERFDLYYTQVYLIDDARHSAVLAAGTGEVGELLLAQGHRLDLSKTTIVTRAAQTQRPVLVSDTDTNPIHRPNPLLPDTRSEVAIPLLVGNEVIGVLDMQARQPDTFREDNLQVFEAMANQLASAVRGAQAYIETQVAVERADALNRRLTGEAWESYLGRIGQDGTVAYEYDLQYVMPLDGTQFAATNNGSPRQLALPVELRGQPIGTIQLEDESKREWTAEETELVQGVAERLALALDQFRAFDDTQKRAIEMEAVAEVGAQAAATLDQNDLLWTVAELVKARFGFYHAHIYLLDEASQNLVLAAGAGEVGRIMIDRGHRIPLSHQYSLVARAARSGAGHIVNDVTEAEDFLPNPMLPRTRSEMATPMIFSGRVIGVLDVQSDRVNYFTEEDMQVQSTLASQIAVAVNNAQLFTEQREVADQLREVDRLKSEFLASMSHELRTPLNSIIGYAEVLLDGIDGDLTNDMTEDVSAIHGSGKHLLNLINDILDLAKIEASQMDLLVEDFSLEPLVADTLNTQRVLFNDRAVDLVLDIPDELPAVHADPLRVRQVISNLVANAIKFTEQGSITIRAQFYEPDPSMLQISVIDTGIGMREDQLSVIFDRFRQVDQSHTRRAGGTGLGLSITRQLIELHGGGIWVESEVGVGSSFHFTLPVTAETIEG